MQFRDQQLHSGSGTLWNAERSESIKVFFVLRSVDIRFEGVGSITQLHVKEMDYRRKEEPVWIWDESTLETDNGRQYKVRKRVGFWDVNEVQNPSEVSE